MRSSIVARGVVAWMLVGGGLAPALAQQAETRFETPAPYFSPGAGGPAAAAAEAFTLEKWQAARDGFAAHLATVKDAPTRARLGFLIASCDSHLESWSAAAAGFDTAAGELPALADYANYEAARAWYFAHDMDKVKDRAGKVSKDAILYAEAQLLLGDALRATAKTDADWKGVAKHYEDYLKAYPEGIRIAEARYWLAEAQEKLGKDIPDALVNYRQVTIEAPLEKWAERSQERFDDLIAKVKKKKQRKKYTTLTAEEHIKRGKVYFDGMRNEESEADYAAALKASGLTKDLKCVAEYHRAQSIFKQRDRARSAPYFDKAFKACSHKTADEDLLVRSAYQGGRAWSSAGEHEKSRKMYEKAAQHTKHSFADDAVLREAEQWAYLEEKGEEGAGAELEKTLASIPERFPDGDMRGEALWRLAWRSWRAQKWQDVIAWLDKEIASVPHDDNYWAEGQTHYWKGRAFEKLGKTAEALAAYERCAREYPLSYYALLALNRLREGAPKTFDGLMAELKKPPAGGKSLAFKARAVYGEPGYQRAVELLRLGLGAEAERELSQLGLKVPAGKKKVTDADQAEQLLATAVLYDRARRYNQSHWILRWSVLDYKLTWPTAGASREAWDLAYPKAFWHLLAPASKAQGYPPELLIAFVREESAFDPIMESFANAIGLTQMIKPTAERFGKGLGFEMSRENLRDPEKNVAVGSRWLGFLWKTFQQRVGLIVGAYNAGEGATWKWLCMRGDWALDEFIEQIPYDETRNYSKRVLNSYFVYQYLADGSVPVVPNDIPASAINQKKCGGVSSKVENADKPDKKK